MGDVVAALCLLIVSIAEQAPDAYERLRVFDYLRQRIDAVERSYDRET